jgi:hypothetical protein
MHPSWMPRDSGLHCIMACCSRTHTHSQDSTSLFEALPVSTMDASMELMCSIVRELLYKHTGYESATEVGTCVQSLKGICACVSLPARHACMDLRTVRSMTLKKDHLTLSQLLNRVTHSSYRFIQQLTQFCLLQSEWAGRSFA